MQSGCSQILSWCGAYPGLKEPLSSSEWAQQPDPCAYDARVVPDKALTSLANAQAAGKNLLIALTAAASIAFMLLLGFAASGIAHARLLAEFPNAFRRPPAPGDQFKS